MLLVWNCTKCDGERWLGIFRHGIIKSYNLLASSQLPCRHKIKWVCIHIGAVQTCHVVRLFFSCIKSCMTISDQIALHCNHIANCDCLSSVWAQPYLKKRSRRSVPMFAVQRDKLSLTFFCMWKPAGLVSISWFNTLYANYSSNLTLTYFGTFIFKLNTCMSK